MHSVGITVAVAINNERPSYALGEQGNVFEIKEHTKVYLLFRAKIPFS